MHRLAVIPTLAALLLLGAGCGAAPSSAPTPATNAPAAAETPIAGGVVINMTGTGFEPSQVTVTVGTTVQFKNTDTRNHWPASAVHPIHNELPGFDALRTIAPGESYAYTFTKVGTWGFHDHLNPARFGQVIVTE